MLFHLAPVIHPRPFALHPLDPEPLEWAQINQINWQMPVVVDVGCGTGDWVISKAKQDPEKFYVGIERTVTKSRKLCAQAQKSPLSNLLVMQADAVALLGQKFAPESVSALYFFYPNPVPKRSQLNQRFFVGPAFSVFDQCLKPGGHICLATNIREYALEAKVFLKQIWGYTIHSLGPVSVDQKPRTAFERKYRSQEQPLHELKAQKDKNLTKFL